VVEFFKRKHGITLQYPQLPGVVPNTPLPKGRTAEIFPIEQLIIMEDQRVPMEKMGKMLEKKVLAVWSV
jgi:hypothetical protein